MGYNSEVQRPILTGRSRFGRRVVLPLVVSACFLLLTQAASPVGAATQAKVSSVNQLLPDFDPLEPRSVSLDQDSNGNWVIAFGTAVDNLGDGPAVLHGERADTNSTMKVTQLISMSDGSTKLRKVKSPMFYAVWPGHQHWHFFAFERYELRSVAKYKLIRPGQKTGFCLMDDYDSSSYDPNHNPPNKPPAPVFTDPCHLNQPDALSVDEGISVGYGDYYNPLLEGQSIDITGVPDGNYYVVFRANTKKAIRESDYKNNASSVQVELSHPSGSSGPPAMQVLATCRDGDHCPVTP